MPKQDRPSSNPEIRPVSINSSLLVEFINERATVTHLYSKLFKQDEPLALHIRRNAIRQGKGDLTVTEQIVKAALESIEAKNRQKTIDTLSQLFDLEAL